MAAKYIKTILTQNDMNSYLWQSMEQRSQIVHNNEVIVINWHASSRSIYVQTANTSFLLTSPNSETITMKDILNTLGYNDKELITTWVYNNNHVDILNSTVIGVELHQAELI